MKPNLTQEHIKKIKQAYEFGYSKRCLMRSYKLTWCEINSILELWSNDND